MLHINRMILFLAILLCASIATHTSVLSAQTKSYGDIDVIMYETRWCPYCKKAKDFLLSLGVSLAVYDVEADKARGEEMLRKSNGSRGVPLIDVEGIVIKGYNPDAIKKAVEKKRM